VALGAKLTAIFVVAAGVFSVVAFDAAFEIFHQLLFPGGSYTFDPTTERLVQLFPEVFWFETVVALGVVLLALSGLVAWLAGRARNPRAET
jgi:integral membrane protein (TIGR01906 family)